MTFSQADQDKTASGCGIGCGVVIAVIILVVWGLSALGAKSAEEPVNGCSKALPTNEFWDCIHRQGIWEGIEDE